LNAAKTYTKSGPHNLNDLAVWRKEKQMGYWYAGKWVLWDKNIIYPVYIEGYTGKYLSEDVFLAAGKRLLTERKLKREGKQNIIFVIHTTLQINIYIRVYTSNLEV
jgi:hypothetical protein